MEQSIWSPLGTPLFRAVWLAALASNVGGWMHLVAAQWEMTSLSDSAALVGLISTASALPAFLLALPAGALADVVDRRRLIVFAQAWQLVVAALLGVLTVADVTTPAVLLGATVVLGFGASLGLPAFSAVTTELVDRERLPAAISLNSVAMTLSQALGPAIGGLLRVGAYVLGYSAVPALLAVLVRTRLDGDASAFGLLLGCVGIGGVLGATLLPRLRGRLGPDRVAASCTLAVAAAVAALATVPSLPAAYPVMVVLGFVSIGVISSLMIAAQAVLPDWVRGRGLAMLGLVFQAGFAAGAACWGVLAAETSVTVALGVAAAFVAVGSLLGLRFRLADAEGLDVRPAHALEPYPPVSLAADDGPVQLSVEYDVPAEDLPAFQLTAGELGRARRRAGAMHWTLYADIRDRQRQVESFTVASWGEHERQSERVTEADRAVFDRVRAFHRGEESPRERALISERPGHRHGGHDAG